jgi:hypothetical protein
VKVQRRAISMMSGLRSQQYEEKLRELGGGEKTSAGHDSDLKNFEGSSRQCEQIYQVYKLHQHVKDK